MYLQYSNNIILKNKIKKKRKTRAEKQKGEKKMHQRSRGRATLQNMTREELLGEMLSLKEECLAC
jgi:hypothetical protein